MADPISQITIRSGPNPGETFIIDQEEVIVGRDEVNDIVINDPEVSRRHARLMKSERYPKEGRVYIEDLGSTNGTFVNGTSISNVEQLRSGDVITFGESVVLIYEKSNIDPESTDVTPKVDEAAPTISQEWTPEREVYPPPPEAPAYPGAQPAMQQPGDDAPLTPESEDTVDEKKRGIPTCLIIGIVAIVVVLCVIAVTMYFMPASWWCAIDIFGWIEACPLP
jgi:pSer/pThr/pTyr-binding forkhead associated (FHA) protein